VTSKSFIGIKKSQKWTFNDLVDIEFGLSANAIKLNDHDDSTSKHEAIYTIPQVKKIQFLYLSFHMNHFYRIM
jgi:hypothetical protein